MNIFEQLKDIIQDKQNLIENNVEFESEFIPFMVQRWLSFHSAQFAQLVNVTSNVFWKCLPEKNLQYKLFSGIIPKSNFKNIKYLKKDKKTKPAEIISKDILTFLAERFELSQREVMQYLETGEVDIKSIKKQLKDA